jgi:predicted nicotinamide N-methyase
VPGYEAFVRSACRLGPVPGVAGIRLHLANDVLALWQRTEDEFGTGQAPPFWAFAWPGGQALARYVLDHPGLVTGRRVLDLGSGSGLVAIAAARAGAAAVRASEVDPLATAAIRLNAAANGVPVPVITGDVLDGDGSCDAAGAGGRERAGVVLAGDVWYSRPLAERVAGFLERATAQGALVLAGDIGRAFLPRDRFRVLDARDVPVMADLEDASVKRAMVLTPAWVPDWRDGNSPGGNSPDSQRAMLGP